MTSLRANHDRHLTIHQSARLIGGFCWVERHAFEVLGAWSAFEPDDGAALAFASASLHHGWHAELWTERLPLARGFATDELVVAPSAQAGDVMGALTALDRSVPTARRLEAWFWVVLPALIDAYTKVLDDVSPVAEGPMRRACDLALDDDRREAATGLVLLDAMDRPGPARPAPGESPPAFPSLDDAACFLADGEVST